MSDQYWDQTVLLLHMDGSNGSTYFRDERHNLINVGGSAQLSTAQKKYGTASAYFNPTTLDTIYTPVNALLFGFGAGAWTVEAWGLVDSFTTTNPTVISICDDTGNNEVRIGIGSDHKPFLAVYHSGAYQVFITATTALALNTQYHLAAVRYGDTHYLFVNGAPEASVVKNHTIPNANWKARIGYAGAGLAQYYYRGYIDDVRVTKGVARYTAAFTPPTSAHDNGPITTDASWDSVVLAMPLTGATLSEALVDLKGNSFTQIGSPTLTKTVAKFFGSAVNFSGNAARVACNNSAALNVSDGSAFTIEFRFNTDSTTGSTGLLGNMTWGGANGWAVHLIGNVLYFESGSGLLPYTLTPSANTWYHVAISAPAAASGQPYAANTVQMRVNGSLVAQNSSTLPVSTLTTGSFAVGNDVAASAFATSRNVTLQDVRVTKGAARYTADFTVPTEPFPTSTLQLLSGIVKDESGTPIARTVRSYRRDTGTLIDSTVSNAVTGAFQLRADTLGEHYVMVLDDTKNALIFDHVMPSL